MIAPAKSCNHLNSRKNGKDPQGRQKFKCRDCGRQFIRKTQILDGMRIGVDKAAQILQLLLEGVSVRAAERITGTHRDTICQLVGIVGKKCQSFLEDTIQDIPAKVVEADEHWGFVGAKQKTCDRLGKSEEYGDAYCFTGIDPTTKLMLTWHLGKRDEDGAQAFAEKLSNAVSGRFQLSTDGFNCYKPAIPRHLYGRCDWGIIIKVYGDASVEDQRKYSPPRVTDVKKSTYMGNPDESKIGTSRIERSNLNTRMHNRRMTRLTNAFSKLWEQHEAMLGLWFAFYNFCRTHMSLNIKDGNGKTVNRTPATAAGLTDKPWSIKELLGKISASCSACNSSFQNRASRPRPENHSGETPQSKGHAK